MTRALTILGAYSGSTATFVVEANLVFNTSVGGRLGILQRIRIVDHAVFVMGGHDAYEHIVIRFGVDCTVGLLRN